MLSPTFFYSIILMGVKWCIILVLHSLMAQDVEHLYMCFLASCTSSLEKCLFRSIFNWVILLFIQLFLSYLLFLSYFVFVLFLDTNPLSKTWLAKKSFLSWRLSFQFLNGVLWSIKVFTWWYPVYLPFLCFSFFWCHI